MEPITAQTFIVADHFSFIDRLARRLADEPLGLNAAMGGGALRATPGLQALFDSIVSASETPRLVRDRQVEEWNPLSQRMLLSDPRPIPASALEADFSLVPAYFQTFVEWSHEAVHILAMEPWFCGRRPLGSEPAFVAWYLAAEGLAFWYADIVVTRTVRETVPTADLVYNRNAVSNTGFHPEQAFRALGLTDSGQILPLYVAAFLGQAHVLRASAHPLCTTLGERIHAFYKDSTSTLRGLFELYSGFGLFDRFHNRFCAIEGLPSLFDAEALDQCATLDDFDYHVHLGGTLLPQLALISTERIRRVCTRRHVQTRAYYAWFMQRCMERGWVFGSAALDQDAVVAALSRYLDALELCLRRLVEGGALDQIVKELDTQDRRYEAEVRTNLQASTAYMRYRYRIFPHFAPTGGVIGLWDGRTDYSLEDAVAVARFVFERLPWQPDLVELLAAFLHASRHAGIEEARGAFNAFLTHPLALTVWSVPLGELSPLNNQFREMAFEFH